MIKSGPASSLSLEAESHRGCVFVYPLVIRVTRWGLCLQAADQGLRAELQGNKVKASLLPPPAT